MNYEELISFLPSLSVKQLKIICNKPRNWGVYNSKPSISGYSKCKNKEDLITLILKHFRYYEEDGSFAWDNYTDKEYRRIFDYQYFDEIIVVNEIGRK